MNLIKEIEKAELGKTHVFSAGQAGFIVKSASGQLLGIDLYLSDCVERVEPDHVGYRRLLPKILEPNEIQLDVLICTHFHRDHFDVDSVPVLMNNDKTELFCPRDCESDAKGLNRVNFINPGVSCVVGDFKMTFVNCDHGTGAPLAVGVIIEVDGKRILEVGDTCLRIDRKQEYLSTGELDLLIAPINGMYGNLDSKDCAILTDLLKPKLVVPCHYGMFAAHHGDVGLFHEKMDKDYPNNKYLIMCLGEKYTF